MNLKRSGYFPASVFFSLTMAVLLNNSCKHDGTPADQLPPINFTQQVLPIFQNSCATSGCHDNQTAEEGYVFNDYAGIMKAITPGNAGKSKAYEAITSSTELMPPGNALSTSQRTTIWLWIEQGAKP